MRSRSIRRSWPVWSAAMPRARRAPRGSTWRTCAPPCSSADCSRCSGSSQVICSVLAIANPEQYGCDGGLLDPRGPTGYERSTPTPPLRVGVAGLGVASTFALPEIAAHPGVRLTAAADARPAAREAFARQYGAPTYATVEALCESPHVDAVYVLTPNRWHARHAIMAAEGGKQVIADKPMALTLADCDAMIAAAQRNGVRLLVGHSQGLDGPNVTMAALVASGELGRLIMVNTWFYSDWLYRPRSRDEHEAAADEGLVLRQGPPQVDIVRMLGGGVARTVRSATSRVDPTRPGEGSYVAYLEFAEGIPATLVHSAYAHFDSSELTHGIGLAGLPVEPDAFPRTRQRWAAFARPED